MFLRKSLPIIKNAHAIRYPVRWAASKADFNLLGFLTPTNLLGDVQTALAERLKLIPQDRRDANDIEFRNLLSAYSRIAEDIENGVTLKTNDDAAKKFYKKHSNKLVGAGYISFCLFFIFVILKIEQKKERKANEAYQQAVQQREQKAAEQAQQLAAETAAANLRRFEKLKKTFITHELTENEFKAFCLMTHNENKTDEFYEAEKEIEKLFKKASGNPNQGYLQAKFDLKNSDFNRLTADEKQDFEQAAQLLFDGKYTQYEKFNVWVYAHLINEFKDLLSAKSTLYYHKQWDKEKREKEEEEKRIELEIAEPALKNPAP